MKINLYNSVGDYSQSCDIEYNAESETERKEAENYYDKFFGRKTELKIDKKAFAKMVNSVENVPCTPPTP